MSDEMRSGHRWAWLGVVFGAALSIAGNGWHVALTESSMGMTLRLVWACIWPVLLLIGIEVLARVRWRNRWLDRLAQFMLTVPVAAVAAVVSYRHQSALILLADPSDAFSAAIGPLAIDGLMLGCTIALLVIRALTLAPAAPGLGASGSSLGATGSAAHALTLTGEHNCSHDDAPTAPAPALPPVSSEQIVSAPAPALTDDEIWRGIEQATAPEGAAPAPSAPVTWGDWSESALTEAREQRTVSGERNSERRTVSRERPLTAVLALLNGVSVSDAASAHSTGESTLRRYAKVIRELREHGPEHPISERVSADIVSMIRDHVRSEREQQAGER